MGDAFTVQFFGPPADRSPMQRMIPEEAKVKFVTLLLGEFQKPANPYQAALRMGEFDPVFVNIRKTGNAAMFALLKATPPANKLTTQALGVLLSGKNRRDDDQAVRLLAEDAREDDGRLIEIPPAMIQQINRDDTPSLVFMYPTVEAGQDATLWLAAESCAEAFFRHLGV